MTDRVNMIYLKNFLIFLFTSKPSMENKINYSKTIVKLKEKQSLKMFNLKKKQLNC